MRKTAKNSQSRYSAATRTFSVDPRWQEHRLSSPHVTLFKFYENYEAFPIYFIIKCSAQSGFTVPIARTV